MIDYLYQTSDLKLFLILSFILISISIAALLFIKFFVPLHLRYQENEVIGCTSALIAVIYGVLAGFATLYLINNINGAADAVQREASALVDIYQDSINLDDPYKLLFEKLIKNYLTEVMSIEWPLMNQGQHISHAGDRIIEEMTHQLVQYKITNVSQQLLVSHILTLTNKLYDARRLRIQASYTSLSTEIWVVILVGTVLLLSISYLFGVNFYLHIFIAMAAALMCASCMFLLIALDKPFQGQFVIGPEPMQSVLERLNEARL